MGKGLWVKKKRLFVGSKHVCSSLSSPYPLSFSSVSPLFFFFFGLLEQMAVNKCITLHPHSLLTLYKINRPRNMGILQERQKVDQVNVYFGGRGKKKKM